MAMPLLAIVLALIVGAIVMIVTSGLGPNGTFDLTLPIRAYQALWQGSLGSENGRVTTLVQAAPLILAGLGVGLGFKAGLFNIGATGQFLVGGLFAVAGSIVVQGSDPIIAIPFALLCGALGGALWGFIPGALKAFSGAHEVVTTIMLNYISYAFISWAVSGPLRQERAPQAVTPDVGNAALPILFGRDGHLGILIAFIAVPIVWFLLYRMTIGFQIRAVGANPDAARYAGMKPRRLIVFTMSVAGLLAGLAGTITILGINHTMKPTTNTVVGFDSITVALLGRSHPVGIMLSAILFGALRAGQLTMQASVGVPTQMVDLLEAIILFFLVISPVLRRVFRLRGVKSNLGTTETISRTYGSEAIR
jgi:simple sugar transport system permease protein